MDDLIHFAIILPSVFFIAVGFIIAILSSATLIILSIVDEHTKRRIAWQKLAETHQLVFQPGRFLKRPQVVGHYHGHHLKLDTYPRQEGRSHYTYTRLVLSVDNLEADRLLLESKGTFDKQVERDIDRLLIPNGIRYNLKGQIRAQKNKPHLYYEQRGFETNKTYLQFLFDLLADLADGYPTVLALGGEVIPYLCEIATNYDNVLQPVATQLLHHIGQETTNRLSDRTGHLFCPDCLTCCEARKVRLPWWQSITYYGCRICGQSREFLNGRLIAVLDSQMNTEKFKQNGVLRVNWLAHRKLFDFDEVEIVQATDEDVERFAVQVGNDTDPKRKPRYEEMRCVVSPECQLSENTMRILQQMFGVVKVGEVVGGTA
jgi:hypothetical protein